MNRTAGDVSCVIWKPYHGASNESQSALGLVLSKLQAADVLQSNSVLIHLFTNDEFHTPAVGERKKTRAFNKDISILKSCTCIWPSPCSKAFSVDHSIPKPISFLFFVTKTGGNCCKLPVKATEEDKEILQEVTASLAAVNEISMDAAPAAVSPEH